MQGKKKKTQTNQKTKLLIILYKYSMKGKDLIPIVVQLISAGAEQRAVRLGSEAARTSVCISQALCVSLDQEGAFQTGFNNESAWFVQDKPLFVFID